MCRHYSLASLCALWNAATNPARPMTEQGHARSRTYARAIRNRMTRLGYRYNVHYREFSNGTIWPIRL